MPTWMVLLLVDSVAILALVDCYGRKPEHFVGGADDRKAWLGWLGLAALTGWLLVGYAIVLGYYFSVVKRTMGSGR